MAQKKVGEGEWRRPGEGEARRGRDANRWLGAGQRNAKSKTVGSGWLWETPD